MINPMETLLKVALVRSRCIFHTINPATELLLSFHSTPAKFQSWHKLSWRDWSSCGAGAGLEVHQSSGIYSLTRDKISSRAHFSAGSHHSHWVSWWWTFCLSFFNKRSLFGGGQEVSWPTTPTTSPQNWKLSADFLPENNPEEGMRDERQEEDNLISGVQYIVFSSYGDYFLWRDESSV